MNDVLPREPDDVPAGKLLLVLLVTMAIFAGGIFWAARLVILRDGALRPESPDPQHSALGRPEIGMVEQRPYGAVPSAQETRAAARARLTQWGWIDREHGIVQMPIDEAMRRVEKGERP